MPPSKSLPTFVLAAAMLAACDARAEGAASRPAPAGIAVSWSSALALDSLSAVPARLTRPFAEKVDLTKDGKHLVAEDCPALLDDVMHGATPADDRALALGRAEGARCLVLQQLAHARPARASYLSSFVLRRAKTAELPPTFAAVLGKRDEKAAQDAESAGKSLRDHVPGLAAKAEGDALVLSTDTWQTRLEVLARGDFDGSGVEELLVAANDTAVEGDFDSTRLLLVTRARAGAPITTVKRLQ